MIPKIIQDYLSLIRHGSNVNSYKLVWAKAIVEICVEKENVTKVNLKEIATKVFKYYWNQTIYFDLIQGNNPNKRPEILEIVRKQISSYFTSSGNKNPKHFARAEHLVSIPSNKIVTILKKDVSWRFLNIKMEKREVYNYIRNSDYLDLKYSDIISSYADVLNESINYKWTQILENWNNAPRIAKKVRIIDLPHIKRKSLAKYKIYLNLQNPLHNCFLCNQEIKSEDLSIDHLIPWSYMYSDDIWNLVYAHKSCNSSKSNSTTSESQIAKLGIRNKELLVMLESDSVLQNKKVCEELRLAIEKDYLKKFWLNFTM